MVKVEVGLSDSVIITRRRVEKAIVAVVLTPDDVTPLCLSGTREQVRPPPCTQAP